MMVFEHLAQLERETLKADGDLQRYYLWPRTPIGNLQAEMWQRVGVSDLVTDDPSSRTYKTLALLEGLVYNRLIADDFTFLDICCGDAVILRAIAEAYPEAHVYGVDLNARKLSAHTEAMAAGVHLWMTPIQSLFAVDLPQPIDVAMMLNTYWGWDKADLLNGERDLPVQADDWFRRNARFVILTVTEKQIFALQNKGFWITRIGRGESGSTMIVMFPCESTETEGLWSAARKR